MALFHCCGATSKKGASYLEMVVINLVPPKAAVKREFLFSINLDSNWMRGLPKNFSYWLCFTHMVLSLKKRGSYLEMDARIPAAHIIQVWDPNPYHISWSISNWRQSYLMFFSSSSLLSVL